MVVSQSLMVSPSVSLSDSFLCMRVAKWALQPTSFLFSQNLCFDYCWVLIFCFCFSFSFFFYYVKTMTLLSMASYIGLIHWFGFWIFRELRDFLLIEIFYSLIMILRVRTFCFNFDFCLGIATGLICTCWYTLQCNRVCFCLQFGCVIGGSLFLWCHNYGVLDFF